MAKELVLRIVIDPDDMDEAKMQRLGLTVDDYLKCVRGCRDSLPGNSPEVVECIKGCGGISGLRITGDRELTVRL
jgi:hypothetical protein